MLCSFGVYFLKFILLYNLFVKLVCFYSTKRQIGQCPTVERLTKLKDQMNYLLWKK